MKGLSLLSFFTLGLSVGFGHCIGMCHPFVLYISGKFVGESKGYKNLFIPHLKYNFGRTLTYGFLGFIAGVFGGIVNIAGDLIHIQKVSAIAAGVFLITYGILALAGYNILNKIESRIGADKATNFIRKLQPKSAFTTGIMLGFLPCGPLYGALIAAASSADALHGGISMILYGSGTIFALMTASVFGNMIMARRGLFNVISLMLMTGMGIFFIYQGLLF